MVDYALAYAAKGWAVFPLIPGGKKPVIPAWEGGQGFKDATCDEATIRAWWERWPDANIGLPIPDGYVVLDVDPRHGGTLEALGEIPDTVIARTGGGGWHVWFKLSELDILLETELRGDTPIPGVDIRAAGKHYVVVAPSVHESGEQYRWETVIAEERVAEVPSRLLDLIRKEAPLPPKKGLAFQGDAQKWLDAALAKAQIGNRNPVGFDLACQLRDDGIAYEDAEWVMREYQRRVDDPRQRYTEQEALNSLTSAYAAPAREKARSRNADPRTVSGAEDSVAQATPSLSSSDQVRGSGDPTAPSGGNDAPEAIPEDGEGIHSFIPFIHSGKTESVWDETFSDLMSAMQEVDALPSDGVVQHLGTNAIERRRRQYNILRSAWAILFPEDRLPQTQMSTWLNMAARSAPGMEGEMVLDAMDAFYHAPHNGPIRNPRAALNTALMNALDPEGQAERRAKKDSIRAEYRKEKKVNAKPANPGSPFLPLPPGEWRDPQALDVLGRMRKRAEESGDEQDIRMAKNYATQHYLVWEPLEPRKAA
jgi:hypothetical protein